MAIERSGGARDGVAGGGAGRGPFPAALATRRLRLRRATPADLPRYCARIYQDPEVMRMLPGGRALAAEPARARAHAHLVDHWQEHGFGPWVVIDRAHGRLIGHCGLRYWPGTREVELLYALEPPAWGQGRATEAAQAASAVAFEQLGLARVVAAAVAANGASIAVLRRLGMRRTGRCDLQGLRVERFELDAEGYRARHW